MLSMWNHNLYVSLSSIEGKVFIGIQLLWKGGLIYIVNIIVRGFFFGIKEGYRQSFSI